VMIRSRPARPARRSRGVMRAGCHDPAHRVAPGPGCGRCSRSRSVCRITSRKPFCS
jgi:hypothetical protein